MKNSVKYLRSAFLPLCASLLALPSLAQQATQANWPGMGGTPGNSHYSSLQQINRANVSRLKEAWRFDAGESGGLETTPTVIDGVLYGLSPSKKVFALEAATGKLIWKFDSEVKANAPSRGLTWWTSGKEKRLLVGISNFLYALEPATGKPIPSFGVQGRIDLRENLDRDPEHQSVSLNTPGVIYKDLIIVGSALPETIPAPPGDIRAYDVRTGKLRWSFHTIPHPGESGYQTWSPDSWKTSGAANNWCGMAVDPERGIVFVPTGSAVPDFYGAGRLGDNLYANTLLALDAATGKLLWHFQGVHHDIWDRDFPAPPILLNIKRDGKTIPAIAQTTKQGVLFVLDRTTGKSLFPLEERPALPSDVPGEVAAKTQPYPLSPEPFAPQAVTEATLTNRTPAAHDWAVKRLHELRNNGPYVPLSVSKDTLITPSFEGGAEWGGPALDPQTGILYINANMHASMATLVLDTGDSPGRSTYLAQCSVCHGDHRQGDPPAFPSLHDVTKRLSMNQITATIHDGKGRMPASPIQGKPLSDLLTYLETGNDPPPQKAVTEEQSPALSPTAQPATPADTAGAAIYQKNCSLCHGDNREGNSAASFPALLAVGSRYTHAQLRDQIRNGKNRMPPFKNLSEQDLDALLRFLAPLDTASAPSGATTPGNTSQYTMTGYRRFVDPDGYPATATPWGTLNALDLSTGKYLWKLPLGQYPELVAQGMADTGSENYGGAVVTAGGLLFIAATNFDHKIRAFDKTNGELLWESTLPFAGNATPATYQVNGRQYLVIAAGGSNLNPRGPIGGIYVAFALPR